MYSKYVKHLKFSKQLLIKKETTSSNYGSIHSDTNESKSVHIIKSFITVSW